MERLPLTVEKREKVTKGANNALRRENRVPAIVYHKGEASTSVSLSVKDLYRILHTDAGRNVLIDLDVQGESASGPRIVVIKEIQTNPTTGGALHVDFHQISLTEKITVNVPIVERGEAYGVKVEKGVLEFPIRELEIECLPTEIPEKIDLDISALKMNEAILVRDLPLPAGVEAISDSETVIVKVVPPHVEAAPEEAPAAAEPEVIGEKEREARQAASADDKAKKKAEEAAAAEAKK
ncbi:MAG: 50S ribosomal protein L25 [Candidatus Omnitrophica bacterium]|nr:50S ribosomal protein L25 [Candidatus Omnitrophota bacterium]